MSAVQNPFSDSAAQPRKLPPLPPSNNKMPPNTQPKSNTDTHNDIARAVRETVTVRDRTETGTESSGTRNRVVRSQTAAVPSPNSRPTQRRSQSQDSANRPDKSKSSAKSRSKKGSQHADVIDRLDFTGVGPMFHHDGPFDACAPSRNKQRNKAPMLAWTGRTDDLAAAGNSAYPSADAYKAFSEPNYSAPPKKKVDAIAEAWGIHEPEPYEEFFAGGGNGKADADTPSSSIYNGRESHLKNRTNNGSKRPKDGQETREMYKDYLENGPTGSADPSRARGATRRPLVPPPKPIFVSEGPETEQPTSSSPPLSPGLPKRSKSLMHRIRKMRDAPNVPVSSDYEPPSPTSPSDAVDPKTSRPTHRPQNSFLGRFGGSRSAQSASDKSEPFVYIEPQSSNNKDLPATPGDSPPDAPVNGYFEGSSSGGGGGLGSPGLGRKTSLMKKMGRVVGRSRQ